MDETETRETLNVWPGVIMTALVCGGMLAASAWAWDKVPDSVPVHFGIDGKPDRFGSKWEGLLIMPGVVALIGVIMAFVPMLDPRSGNLARSAGFYYAVWIGMLGVMSIAHTSLIMAAMGMDVNVGQWIAVAVGGLLVVMGNFMGKSRPNWFAGFRTPWTMSSDYAWQMTHRVTGGMFMAVGAATVLAALLWHTTAAIIIMTIAMFVTVFYGAYISYSAWKNDPERTS
jgi:uncharacterized membrane protein